MPTELTCEAKETIRSFVFSSLAIPAVVLSILTFCLGYSIRVGAYNQAIIDTRKEIIDTSTQSKLLKIRLAELEQLTKESEDAINVANSAFKTLSGNLESVQSIANATKNIELTSDNIVEHISTNPEFLNKTLSKAKHSRLTIDELTIGDQKGKHVKIIPELIAVYENQNTLLIEIKSGSQSGEISVKPAPGMTNQMTTTINNASIAMSSSADDHSSAALTAANNQAEIRLGYKGTQRFLTVRGDDVTGIWSHGRP